MSVQYKPYILQLSTISNFSLKLCDKYPLDENKNGLAFKECLVLCRVT